jgi:tetratricopeptide (TPR) repeat protein
MRVLLPESAARSQEFNSQIKMRFVRIHLRLRALRPDASRTLLQGFGLCASLAILIVGLMAQETGNTAASGANLAAKQGIDLAAKGRCREALPKLNSSIAHVFDKSTRYRVEMASARCAMSIDDTETAASALFRLRREFPDDPEVLYTTTHFFSELAMRSSQELAAKAPGSSQAQQLEAEAFESQGKWDQATLQYQKILEQNPRTPGIHYRLGRIFLAKSPPDEASANKEFEEELKVDPENAPAEFMLGESARQAGRWDEAAARFSKVTMLDEGFLEAYLALGMSLNAAGKFPDAIAPLQKYVKLQPGDPAGHYQLGMAYARTGRKQDADHEMQMQQEAAAKEKGRQSSTR